VSTLPFSTVIPTLQDGALLKRALDSLIIQTRLPDEVIVVDHGSTDGTDQVFESFKEALLARAPQTSVKIVRYAARLPVAENWNRAVAHVTTGHFHIFHSDDELAPTFYERTVSMFENRPDLDYLSTRIFPIDGEGNPTARARNRLKDPLMAVARASGLTKGRGFLLMFGMFGTMLYCPAVLFKKSFFDRVGGFNSEFSYCVDFEMWIRAIRSGGRYAYLPEPLYRYRISEASTAERDRFQIDYFLEEFRVYHLPWRGSRLLSLLSVPALTMLLIEDLLPLSKDPAHRFAAEVTRRIDSPIWSAWLKLVAQTFVGLKK